MKGFLVAVVPTLLFVFIGAVVAVPAQAALTPEEEQLCAEVLANPDGHPQDLVQWCSSQSEGDERGESPSPTPDPGSPPSDPGSPPPSSDPGDEDGKPGHGYGDGNHSHDGPPGQNK